MFFSPSWGRDVGGPVSGPLRYAIVDGMNVRDSRVHNSPPRLNTAPSQELLGRELIKREAAAVS
jgi:hypothetical protein